MKFVAILKDSVREAMDSKVFYVMIGLSALTVLFVASISYQPVSVENDLTRMTQSLTFLMARQSHGMPALSIRIEDFKQTNDTPSDEPWLADYRFRIVWEFPEELGPDKFPKEARRELVKSTRDMMRQGFSYLNDVEVTEDDKSSSKTVALIIQSHGSSASSKSGWLHEPRILFAIPVSFIRMPLGDLVNIIETSLVNTFGAGIALLLSTIITAFFIPNMLRKGSVDLLLVKPVHRATLLLYKFVGGLSFIFLNTVFIVAGIWLVVGLRSGLWSLGFLLSILVITYQFAVYYSISTLFGVLTRSPIVSILVTCFAWFIFWLIGTGYGVVDATRLMTDPQAAHDIGLAQGQQLTEKPFPDWVYTTADVLHFATPRMKDLDGLSARWITRDLLPPTSLSRKQADTIYRSIKWTETLSVTSAYILVFLGLSCLWFGHRDY